MALGVPTSKDNTDQMVLTLWLLVRELKRPHFKTPTSALSKPCTPPPPCGVCVSDSEESDFLGASLITLSVVVFHIPNVPMVPIELPIQFIFLLKH